MKLSDYKCFQHLDLLPAEKFQHLLSIKDQYVTRPALHIDANGTVQEELKVSPGHVSNHGTNEDLNKIFDPVFVEMLVSVRDKIMDAGAVNPRLAGLRFYRNADSMSWHKDFSYDKIPDHLRWSVFYILFPDEQEPEWQERFTISATEEWPHPWGLGVRNYLTGNLLTGHNHFYGHEFVRTGTPANYNDIVGMVWHDERLNYERTNSRTC